MTTDSVASQEFLRYGQIIRIHGNEAGNKRGLIAVKGFTDLDAMYIVFTRFRNIDFYRQGLFQILPRGVFEIHDQFRKKKKEGDSPQAEASTRKVSSLELQELDAQKKIMKERLQAERQQYEQLAKSKMGEYINFGDDVIFKHVDSNAYLSGSVRCSDGGLGSFKVELSDTLSSILVFKLLPFRSYEKEGDRINLLGPIRIKNIENRCYLSRQDIDDDVPEQVAEKNEQDSQLAISRRKSQHSLSKQEQYIVKSQQIKLKKFNIVTTYSQSQTWLIHLHENFSTLSDTQTIRTHDLIYLVHTQNDGYLAIQQNGLPYLKELLDNEYPCYSCIWEVEFLPLPIIAPPIIEKEQSREENYCLRDILTSTQLRLGTSRILMGNNEIKIVNAKGISKGGRLKDKDLIKICQTGSSRELDVGEEFYLKTTDQLQYMLRLPYVTRELKLSGNQTQHGFRVIKVDDQTKLQVLFVLSTYEVLNDFANQLEMTTFRIQQQVKAKKLELVDYKLCQLIAFVKGCSVENIHQESLPKKKYQMILKDLEICKIIFRILQKMGSKIRQEIYKSYKKENQLFKTVFNRSYSLVLQIIRNNPITKLYVAEEWMQCIQKNAIQIEEHESHVVLNEILRSNEAVVGKFLQDTLLSQILQVFILKPPHEKFLNILRSSCICDGKPIVRNQNEIQRQFFRILDRTITFKFVPQDNSVHQSVVDMGATLIPPTNSIAPEEQAIKYKVKIRSCISKSMEKERSLETLYRQSEELDCFQTWNYFLAFLNLLADICFGRNSTAKDYVEDLLTKDLSNSMKQKWARDPQLRIDVNDRANQSLYILILILEDKEIGKLKSDGKDALRAILRLINFAFVDTVKQNPIVRLSRLRYYDQISQNVEINRTPITEDNKLLEKVMAFLQNQIRSFKSFQSTDIKEKEFLLTVLDLLKSSLVSGYWQKYEGMLEMLKLLLKILKNEKDEIYGEVVDDGNKKKVDEQEEQERRFKIYKAQAKRPTSEVQLITRCKMLACDLIEIILDFRTDLRVSHCTLIFKDVLTNPQKYKQFSSNQERDVTIGSDTDSIISFEEGSQPKVQHTELENPGVWAKLLAKKMEERDELKNLTEGGLNLNLIMMQLTIYENPDLIARLLNILKRIHCRLSEIIHAFTEVGLVADQYTKVLINEISSRRKHFTVLDDENLLDKDLDDTNNGVVFQLNWLAHACKTSFNIDNFLRNPQIFNKSRQTEDFNIFRVFTQKDDIHLGHQQLIKCLDIHFTLLKFIAMCKGREIQRLAKSILRAIYCFLILLTRYNLSMKFEIAPHIRLIRQSIADDYGALQLLYELYSNNKNNLYKSEEVEQLAEEICQLIQKRSIQDIYKAKLMHFFHCLIYYNEDVIKANQGAILAKLQDSKKTKIFFQVQEGDDCLNIPNIKRWLGNFAKSIGNQLTKKAPVSREMGQRSPLRRKGTLNIDTTKLFQVDLPPQLMYYMSIFNTFSSLIQGPNRVNIGKCKQVHSYKFLLQLLNIPEARACYPLKRNIRAYINRLYYIDDDYENLNEHIINTEIPKILQDLDLIIMILLDEVYISKLVLSNPIRFQYFETYFYLYLEELLVSLHEILHKDKFKNSFQEELARNYSRGKYYLHYELMRIFERLRWLHNKYNNRFIKSFIRTVTEKIKNDYLIKFVSTAKQIFHKNEQGVRHERPSKKGEEESDGQPKEKKKENQAKREKALEQRSRFLISILNQGRIQSYFKENRVQLTFNYPLTFQLPQEDQKQEMLLSRPAENHGLVQKLMNLIFKKDKGAQNMTVYYNAKLTQLKRLFEKPSFRLYIDQEFNKGCLDLFRIDQNSMDIYSFNVPFLSLRQFIKTIVKINTERPEALSIDLKMFFFRVLRQYIEEKNTKHDGLLSIDQWDSEYWSENAKQIAAAQEFLNQSDIPQLIIESLRRHQDLELDNEIILFGIAFILGGNRCCQNSILEKFKQDKRNDVFLNIQALIVDLSHTIENFNKIKVESTHSNSSFNYRLIDDYDSFDGEVHVAVRRHTVEPPGPYEVRLKILSALVFKRVFRFLQLLCQNNHVANKNYFRQQRDVNNNLKLNSINMIELSTFEIRRLFKIMSKDIVRLPMEVLDFINEINQIPCQQNQKILCKTTFFQDFCYMANYLSEQDNQIERKFVRMEAMQIITDLDILYELYNKCISIVICVMEGNHESIYRELSVKLQNRFLMDIIQQNLATLDIQTDQPGSDNEIHRLINEETEFLMKPNLINAINVLIIIQKVKEYDPQCRLIKSYELYLKQNIQMARIHQALYSHILKIELRANRKKQTVYFPKHPVLNQLSGETRDRIMLEVGRETQCQKIVSLFSFKQEVFNEIQHNFTISKKQKLFGFVFGPRETQSLLNFSLLVSVIINILWFLGTNIIIEYQEIEYVGRIQTIISGLAVVQVTLTLLYLYGYVRSKAHLAACRAAEAEEREAELRQKAQQLAQPSKFVKQPVKPPFHKRILLSIWNALLKFFNLIWRTIGFTINLTPSFIKRFFYNLKVLLVYDPSFKGALFYTIISLLGLFYSHHFYLLHQIFVFTRIQTLQNVFQAVLYSPKQLLSVSLLGVVFVYVFCIIGYETYAKTLHENPQSQCDTVLGCIINLYVSGTLGGGMEQFSLLRFIYDMIYFVFFGILFGNIVSGIMIDTFAALRSSRQEIKNDKDNKCYICGMDRATIEKHNEKFGVHIKKYHFLWNYIFYLYCLDKKGQMEKSGLEYDISNRIKDENDISWIPIYESDEDGTKTKIDGIGQTLDKIEEETKGKIEGTQETESDAVALVE